MALVITDLDGCNRNARTSLWVSDPSASDEDSLKKLHSY
jgi:hypothetical protein